MVKRLYLANGTLQTSLPKWSEDISVDAGTATYMASILGIGDWAYLAIRWDQQTEIIKVSVDYSGLQVDRAQDGTKAQAFPAGSSIVYQLTQAEIQDAIDALELPPLNLYPSGYGVAQVSEVNGTWSVAYPPMETEVAGGIHAFYETSDGKLYLTDYFPAAGCCVEGGSGAPLIPGPFFYFTSQPYALEATDYMQPGPNPKYPNENSFGFGNLWLLTQPDVIEPSDINTYSGINYVNVFGSQGAFSAFDEYVEAMGVYITDVNVFGTQGSFAVSDESMMDNNCYILQALLYGNVVSYTYGVDKYIATKAVITGATLS